ncbi:MAG: FAD-dependent oxidoreductase [Gammaproteobacteria bacterium]
MLQAKTDITIFGGGIAGLWTLARLRQAGFSAVLFESKALGGVQTIASQGIIHGGAKYALSGNLTASARTIGEMPRVWRECLEGRGELDLRRVKVLCEHQYLWSTTSLISRMAGFFAGKAMRSRMTQVEPADRPEPFQHPEFGGTLYRLEEQVLDIASLVAELARQLGEYCYRVEQDGVALELQTDGTSLIKIPRHQVELQSKRLVLTGGKGNAALLKLLGRDHPAMQLRPLHMAVVKGDLPPMFAHCLGSGTTPRITVTSCPTSDGHMAWYLGGQVAESGVERTPSQQIAQAKQELAEVLPWIDISAANWSTLRIDRAEAKTTGGLRPDSYNLNDSSGVITAWPTKLAFAPRLAQEIQVALERDGIRPEPGSLVGLDNLPRPAVALPPWEIERE